MKPLTFDNLFPPLRHTLIVSRGDFRCSEVEWRGLSQISRQNDGWFTRLYYFVFRKPRSRNPSLSVFQIKFAGITINLGWITTMNYTSSKTGEISKIDPQRSCRSMSHVVLSSGNLTNDRCISLNHKTLSSLLTVTFTSRAHPYNGYFGLVSAVHACRHLGAKQKSWWPFKWNLFAGIFFFS